MRERHSTLKMDLSYLAVLMCFFLGVFIIALDAESMVRNSIFLCAAFIVYLVTYYTNLTTGITLSIVLAFLIATFAAVYAVQTGAQVPLTTFFWVLWVPLTAWAISSFLGHTVKLQEENATLTDQIEQLATIDKNTGLKNLRAFENDADVYMKISKRYDMELTLMIWQFAHPEETARVFVGTQMTQLVRRVSQAIGSGLRAEDVVYLIDTDPYRWGLLAFTNPSGITILQDRVKEALDQLDTTGILPMRVDLEFLSTHIQYDQANISSLAFLDQADKNPMLE